MNGIFEKEWELYRKGGKRAQFKGGKPRGDADFDTPVKVGEIRIFADMARPFVALVAEERGAGYFIIPVSPFTVPASPREALEGERVYQLWNSCTASKGFAARSWIVDTVDEDAIRTLLSSCPAKTQLSAGGVAAEYEREFLVSGGDFIPLAEKCKPETVHVSWRKTWGIAASFAILLGVSVVVLRNDDGSGSPDHVATIPQPAPLARESKSTTRSAAEETSPMAPQIESACAMSEEAEACIPEMGVQSGGNERKASVSREPMMLTRSTEATRSAPPRMLRKEKMIAWVDAGWSRNPCGTEAERYAEFTENDWKNPASEPLSTFGLDVDTSSYTTMRRYLTEMKRLPPEESVRLEEYVNYFKYSYPQPEGDDPIAVCCEMGECPWTKSHKLLRVGVQAKTVPSDKIPPCNLTFLIDISGSMGYNGGFGMMKAGLGMLVDKLRPEDNVAIVTYASGTSVRLHSTPGSEKAKIRDAIESLQSGGGTAGASGIQLAYEEAKKNFDKKANNRVVLITDGDFNVGISSPKALEDFIAEKRESGIFLTVIGVGAGNYQDATMKKLSSAGNGNYAYLDSVLEAKKVMMTEFGGTMLTVAKDVKLQLEFNPAEVNGYRLLGYESRRLEAKDFNDDKKDAGEIGSGHTMTALYELIPAGSSENVGDVDPLKYQQRTETGRGEVCTVKLRWKKPDGEKSVLKDMPVAESAVTPEANSTDFLFASAVAEFALLLEDSPHKGSASFASIIERAKRSKGEDPEGYRAEFIRLAETAELVDRR
ncbi:MAG: von Willebrand factor type A domain-containing protein [Kiritimatiellae bacterium]|nr:von Willebrand factor type A domain-containing protein [Kiritimatiellia bacterium]